MTVCTQGKKSRSSDSLACDNNDNRRKSSKFVDLSSECATNKVTNSSTMQCNEKGIGR